MFPVPLVCDRFRVSVLVRAARALYEYISATTTRCVYKRVYMSDDHALCSQLAAGPPDHGWARVLGALLGPSVEGVVINLGARWEAFTKGPNRDAAWELAAANERLRVIAFEMKESHMTRLVWTLNHSVGAYRRIASLSSSSEGHSTCRVAPCSSGLLRRSTLLREAVHPHSICDRLASLRAQPSGALDTTPVLLKVDIDSFDWQVVDALLRCGYRPRAIFVEYNEWVPLPLTFAALAVPAGAAAAAAPRYGFGYNGKNVLWPCHGASLGMWDAWSRLHSYRVVAADKSNALLLADGAVSAMQKRQAQVHSNGAAGTSSSRLDLLGALWHGRCTAMARVGVRRGLGSHAEALRTIDARCNATQTPYTLEGPHLMSRTGV